MARRHKLALLAVTGIAVMLSTLVFGTGAQAAARPDGPGIEYVDGPPYYIINKYSNKCLQPQHFDANALINQRTCGPWGTMPWNLQYVGNGYYWIVNDYTQMCMDLQANSEAEVTYGTLVQQFPCSTIYPTEQWRLVVNVPTGYYQLVNRVKGLCADIQFRSPNNGALLQVIECKTNEPAQLFRFA